MPMYKVLVHNDPVTTIEFVVKTLMDVFRKTEEEACLIAREANDSDIALVDVMPLEHAEMRVEIAHSLALSAKCPLKFTIEPE
jgi:ATP-dependent Clp protease adaptor protein ClpS